MSRFPFVQAFLSSCFYLYLMNRLSRSSSSYLKKAENEPIDWYPWCDEAFERAKSEDKPVLLSIGAVWCHWCHVMAHESWDDPEIARLVNERFVAIKVDRDERPDLDKAYQEAVGALTGQGGWPLTVFLMPDKEPFYGGTYFPKISRYGMPSFKDVIIAVSQAYKGDRSGVMRTADELKKLRERVPPPGGAIDPAVEDRAISYISANFDSDNGGFGTAPKFPYSETLLFLLQICESGKDESIWHIVDTTLRKMAAGGFYDQVGGGFHRYSVDSAWKVPHFEKMLNDNALLLKAYLEAYRLSGAEYFRQVAGETIDFILRRMVKDPAGFVSSIDADLHGEEGAYFTWTEAEIREALGEKSEAFIKAYNVQPGGNFEVQGKNVLYAPGEPDKSRFAAEKRKLLEARQNREQPYIDRSIHTSWTSLMATSLVIAHEVLNDRRSLDYAVKTMDFMMEHMFRDGTVYRVYTDKPSIEGFLDDYSCTIEALLELFKSVQDRGYLDMAVTLTDICDSKFYDPKDGGYFFVQEKDRTPLSMDKPITDFSVPAPNPQLAMNMAKLYYYTGEERYLKRAKAVLDTFVPMATAYPMGCGTYFSSLDHYLHRPLEAIVEADRVDGERLVHMINGRVGKAVVMLDTGESPKNPLFEGKTRIDGKPTIYFCKEGACEAPLTDIEKIEEYLKRKPYFFRP